MGEMTVALTNRVLAALIVGAAASLLMLFAMALFTRRLFGRA
jgi:hypothetical protein